MKKAETKNRIHEIVAKGGDVRELQEVLRGVGKVDHAELLLSKDVCGEGLLHKAVCKGYFELVNWILKTCPGVVHIKDKFDRTALHYAPLCPDPQLAWSTLIQAGVHPAVKDKFGRTAKFYMDHPGMIKPNKGPWDKYPGQYHAVNQEFVMKPASIRIWIHDQDLARLIRVIWEGHGSKLLTETSRQPTVKRFLESVPFIMGKVRDIHQSTIQNDLPKLMKVSADPVPVEALSSKDCNGLTPLHKAAGLGFKDIVEYLLSKDAIVNQADSFGRTPLHYAGMKFGNAAVYNLLLSNGAADNTADSKGKLAKHYLARPNERPDACLSLVPSAPRTVDLFPMAWDWDLYNTRPWVLVQPRSSLQAERDGGDFVSARKTKSEGNLNKVPVRRKVKKMFEEDVAGKNKTNTLILDQYNEAKIGRKEQNRQGADTTHNVIEDNESRNQHKSRSRSRTISGPYQNIAGKSKNNIPSNEENLGLSEPENRNDIRRSKSRENENYLSTISNRTNGPRNKKSAEVDEEDDRNRENDFRTSYQNYPEYRQPFSRNYEGNEDYLSGNFEHFNKIVKNTLRKSRNSGHNQETDETKLSTVRRSDTATLERDMTMKKEDQDVMSSVESGTDRNSTQEVPETKIMHKHKRRKRHFRTDDSRIIVNTFNSIQDMQKSLEDEINAEENGKKLDKLEAQVEQLEKTNVEAETVKESDGREKNSKKESTRSDVIVNKFDPKEDFVNRFDPKDDIVNRFDPEENIVNRFYPKEYKESTESNVIVNRFDPKEYIVNRLDPKEDILNRFDPKEDKENTESNVIVNTFNSKEDMKNNSIEAERNNVIQDVKKANHEQREEYFEAQHDDAVISKLPGDFGRIYSRISLDDDGDAILRNNYNLTLMDHRDVDHDQTKDISRDNIKHSSKDEVRQNEVIKTYSVANNSNHLSHLKRETQNNYNSNNDERKSAHHMENFSQLVANKKDLNENDSGAEMSNNENSSEQEDVDNEETQQTRNFRKPDETLDNNDETVDRNDTFERFAEDRNKRDEYDKEQRIEELIEEGDLEKLADLILEGDGELLRGKQSQHSEVQRFLTNVPSYMVKIKKIHLACHQGDLRELLHSLDRRKFAVGREDWSGLRMTPLHVAVLYRNSAIVRYLAGRFPESLHARDIHGRTPLHYAGTLPDRTFYNLLLTLGAYQTLLDDKGLQPSDYFENKETCYTFLIALYENNPDLNEMEKHRSELVSSGDLVSANQTSAIFIPEEGRYLAAAIGDPLIKGLQKIIKERPDSPVTCLANFLFKYEQQKHGMDQSILTNTEINSKSVQSQQYMVENQNEIPQNVTDQDHINAQINGHDDSTGQMPKDVTEIQQEINAQMNGERNERSNESTGEIPQGVTNQEHINAQISGHNSAGIILPRVTNQDHINAPITGLGSAGKTPQGVTNQEHINSQINGHNSAGKILQGVINQDDMNAQINGSNSAGKNIQGVTNNDHGNAQTNGLDSTGIDTPQATPEAKAVDKQEFGDSQSVKSSEQAESDDGVGKTSFEHVYRDDHGQSPIHFAASRSQGRNALSQLLEELDANIAYRDELYRTPRDLAEENNLHANIVALDKHVFHMGARGDTEKLLDLLLEGYDHILDLEIEEDIVQEAIKRGHAMTLSLLQSIPTFEERREKLHRAIRLGSDSIVREMLNREAKDAKLLAVGKNNRGRCCLHIAILSAQENIVKIISSQFPLTLNIGDNMERTSLHYAMGVAQVETLSAILIQGGAQRTIKDLKGRTASYYFMNKSAIRALQEEENMLRI